MGGGRPLRAFALEFVSGLLSITLASEAVLPPPDDPFQIRRCPPSPVETPPRPSSRMTGFPSTAASRPASRPHSPPERAEP